MPLEYSGEEQAICAVGIVRPRPGVFVEAIQYVLVLCTTVEVISCILELPPSSPANHVQRLFCNSIGTTDIIPMQASTF